MPSKPLPPNSNPSFVADYPSAFVYPAHPTNYYRPETHNGVPNFPNAWVLHTPEEPSDDNETTPAYFAIPGRAASTHYYLDSDGDVFQLVPEYCAAIANGLKGKPIPVWAQPTSLNWQTLSVEIEGYAHSIHQTMPVGGVQFNSLVELIKNRAHVWGIPLDRTHIMGHYELSIDRSDPGALFPWHDLMKALTEPEPIPIPEDTRHMVNWAIVGLENPFPDAYFFDGASFFLIPDAVVQEDLRKLIYENNIIELHAVTWEFLDRCGYKRKFLEGEG